MKLRSQLILAFLLLAILPLSGIVLYSYVSSTKAFRRAVEEESRQLTAEIEGRMGAVKTELRSRLRRVSRLPVSRLAMELEGAEPISEALFRELLDQMGEAASWIESVEFIPTPPTPAAPPPGQAPSVAAAESGESLWLNIDRDSEEATPPDVAAEYRISLLRHLRPQGAEGERWAEDREQHRQHLEQASTRIVRRLEHLEQKLEAENRRSEERSESLRRGEIDTHTVMDEAIERGLLESEIRDLEVRREQMVNLLGDEFSSTVTEGERVLGYLKAAVSAPQMVREVLRRTRRDKGEVPFALDGQANLYASNRDDLTKLESLPLALSELELDAGNNVAATHGSGDWVVVARKDPDSELVFGIVRPIGASLSQIRSTSVRNFGLGVGLIGLALLGMLPISGRLTRNLNRLTQDVERLAAGDLEVRTAVTSEDELGQLAGAFNRMAGELQENQSQLLEQERRSKEQELERRLLAAENDRKSEELEEARRFQLSLLPKRLPRHPDVELAVFMQTATEVGGDYYDFHEDEDGSLIITVGDATGHGAKAGTMVTAIKSLFVSLSAERGVGEFLVESARAVKRMQLGRMSMALSLARVHGRRLTVASAGMPPVLICRGESVEEIELPGLPLGAALECAYEEHSTELAAGDTVLLLTDGFPELLDGDGEPLGYLRVRELFARAAQGSPRELVERLAAAISDWTGGESPSDDVTFVVLRAR